MCKSIVMAACCLVLLSVCSVDAQEDLAHFDVGSALGEGYRLLDEGMFDRAEAVFKDVIAHDPKNRAALEGMVWVAFSSGRYEEAGRAADKVRILDPQDIGSTRKWIEVVWHDPARRDEALAAARSLLVKDQDDIKTRLLLANLLSRDSKTWTEAATEYEKVLARAPQNVQALTGRARLAIWTGHLDNAQREILVSGLRKARGEDNFETRLLLAHLLSLDPQTKPEAIAEYEKALEIEPRNRDALEGLVWVTFSSGRYVEAGRVADKVRILEPQDIGWTRKWIEVVWHDPARRGEALAEARSLLAKDQDDIETRLLLAKLLSRDSQTWAEAVTEYDKVLARAPQNVQALTGQARLAIWTGALDKAYRFLQMALAVDPTNTGITDQIESIKRAAKELSHSRMQLFVPLALIIMFLSIGIGYSGRELTCKVYLLLFLQVAALMSLAALWVYVPPTTIARTQSSR